MPHGVAVTLAAVLVGPPWDLLCNVPPTLHFAVVS